MNEACVTKCAPQRNTSWFELKAQMELQEMPPFPLTEWQNCMTPKERQTCAGVYLAKIVDRLQGREQRSDQDMPVWTRSTRPRNGRS